MFIYIFTTYPLYSETFLQREQVALDFFSKKRLLFSLWKGGNVLKGDTSVDKFYLRSLVKLPYKLLFWFYNNPSNLLSLLETVYSRRVLYLENLLENALGFSFGVLNASYLLGKNPAGFHSAWLSAPATSAMTLNLLTGGPFSSGAHAYDIFQSNGDFLLGLKSVRCSFLHTSTFEGLKRLYAEVFFHKKIKLIRRGLDKTPGIVKWKFVFRGEKTPVRFLSVGRLVEKKDYGFQINLLHFLKCSGVKFKYTLVGRGSLKREICLKLNRLGLRKHVNLISTLTFSKIKGFYKKADVFIFSGKISCNGDRDGLPNVVPEATAFGLPSVVSYIGGLPEFLGSNPNGILVSSKKVSLWKRKILYLLKYNKMYNKFRRNGYFWVVKNFNAYKNTSNLINKLENYFK